MAFIEVNHQTLKSVASSIRDYCDFQDQQMAQADSQVKRLVYPTCWRGEDTNAFIEKWSGINSGDSTAVRLRTSLESYAKGLDASAALYAKAQEQAYTAACWLPKLLW